MNQIDIFELLDKHDKWQVNYSYPTLSGQGRYNWCQSIKLKEPDTKENVIKRIFQDEFFITWKFTKMRIDNIKKVSSWVR